MGESSDSIHKTKKLKIISGTPTCIQQEAELATSNSDTWK
jgi:hypothetical protein